MSWLGVAALGAFHGLNPAMGWLFAVALGQQERRSAAVLRALPPVAAGHLLSVAAVVAVARAAGALFPAGAVRMAGGVLLLAFALWLYLRPIAHRGRIGMRVGMTDLIIWSLLMTTAHGAGLMLLPAMLAGSPAGGGHQHHLAGAPLPPLLLLLVHTAAMMIAMGIAALVVHHFLGLGFLRRRWINLDLLWIVALVAAAGTLILY